MKLTNALRHADDLMDLLVDAGPLTSEEIREALGWGKGKFATALSAARKVRCPELGLVIPSPTPDDGWRYQVTTEWGPVEQGVAYSMGGVETRLLGVQRDVNIILPHLTKGTREWRRANFLRKHLAHILGTLEEIDNG